MFDRQHSDSTGSVGQQLWARDEWDEGSQKNKTIETKTERNISSLIDR